MARQLLDTVNYQRRFDQSQTRIKFEYIIMQHIRSFSVVFFVQPVFLRISNSHGNTTCFVLFNRSCSSAHKQ